MYMRIRSAMKRARDKREFLFSGKGNEPVLTVTVSKHVVYVHRFFFREMSTVISLHSVPSSSSSFDVRIANYV